MSLLERIAISIVGNLLALWAAVLIVGDIDVSGYGSLVIAAIVFGLINLIVKPVVKLLSLPVIILTFGIALFFINMAMFALTAWIVSGLDVGGLLVGGKGHGDHLGGQPRDRRDHPPGPKARLETRSDTRLR